MELSKFRAKELLRVGKVLGEEAAHAAKGKKFVVLNLTQLQGDGKALDEAAKVSFGATLPVCVRLPLHRYPSSERAYI